MPLESARHGLLARALDYEPLRAFSQGGRYWDRVPQQLIREGPLGEFLPPVESEEDERGKFGRFFRLVGKREVLAHSHPVGRRGVPSDQLRRLQESLEQFKQKAALPGVQPQNREFIERFRLPDIALHPELYRLAGPWWNPQLQILWGCERARDSSLPAAVAVGKVRGDHWHLLRRLLKALLLLLLSLLLLWAAGWAVTHASRRFHAGSATPQPARVAPAAGVTNPASPAPKTNAAAAKPPRQPLRPGAPDARTAAACQIILVDQDRPDADGSAEVTLEVRTSAKPIHPVAVEIWHVEGTDTPALNRLHTRLKAGDHRVSAVILDADDQPVSLSAVVTVVPNKVTTTPGKVSVRPKKG